MDGLHSVIARKLVVAALRPGLAPTLHLRMAARLALGTRPSCATYEHVQVWLDGDDWVLTVVVNVVLHGVDATSLTGTHNSICEKSHVRTQPTVAFTH